MVTMAKIMAWLLLSGLIVAVPAAQAGVWFLVDSQEAPGSPPLFGIVHPPGFTGAGGHLTVRACTAPLAIDVRPALQNAMALWSELTPNTGNCQLCQRAEDIPLVAPVGPHLASVILHELGHCAMGLAHVNLTQGMFPTSFTNNVDSVSIDVGLDGVRGSADDRPSPLPGTRLIHWFRIADNNPVVVDGTIIDQDSFTRALSSLPSGHVWSASANSDFRSAGDDTSDLLGFPNTQAVMYSFHSERQVYTGLSADDVSTVKMAMTGLDNEAGTGDDYTFGLQFEPDCAQANIEVQLVDPTVDPDLPPGALGRCIAEVTGIPNPPNQTQHFFLHPATGNARILIKINDNVVWDYELVLRAGFESGDTTEWSSVVPAAPGG